MINKIIASIIFVSCLFALSLSLLGVEGPIQLGPQFRVYLATTSRELESFKIAIPSIPTIPEMGNVDGINAVINVLRQFINGLVNILNFIILAINTIIKVIQFLFILLKNFVKLRDNFIVSV